MPITDASGQEYNTLSGDQSDSLSDDASNAGIAAFDVSEDVPTDDPSLNLSGWDGSGLPGESLLYGVPDQTIPDGYPDPFRQFTEADRLLTTNEFPIEGYGPRRMQTPGEEWVNPYGRHETRRERQIRAYWIANYGPESSHGPYYVPPVDPYVPTSLPDGFDLGLGENFQPITQRDIFGDVPTPTAPAPRVYTDTELGYDSVDPNAFDFQGAVVSDYILNRPDNPEGIETLYEPITRNPYRDDWDLGEFRPIAGYDGDWLTEEQFAMVSDAENFIESLLLESDAADFGSDVDAYMTHLSLTNEALFQSHSIDLNKSNFAFENYGELYRFQQNISAAEWSEETGTLSRSDLLDNARYFLWDAVTNGAITPERYSELVNDPVALNSLIDSLGNIDLNGPTSNGPTLGEPDFAYANDDVNFTQRYVLIDSNDPQSGYIPYHPPGSWVNADGALMIAEVVKDADGVERTIIKELMADAFSYPDLDAVSGVVKQQPDLEIHYFPNDPTAIRPYMWDFELNDWVPILYPGEEVRGDEVYSRDANGNMVFVRDYKYTIGLGDDTPEEQALFEAYTPEELTALEQRRSSNLDLLNERDAVVSDVSALEASVTDAAEVARLAHLAADAPGATDADRAAAADADTVLADLRTNLEAARLAAADDGDDGDLLINDSGSPIRTRNAARDGYEPLTDQQVDDLFLADIDFFGNDPDHERPYLWNDITEEWEVVLWANQRLLTTGENAGHVIDIHDGFVRNQLAYDVGPNDKLNDDGSYTQVGDIRFDQMPTSNGVYDLQADVARTDDAVLHLYAIDPDTNQSVLDLGEALRTGFGSKPIWAEDTWQDATANEVAFLPDDRKRYIAYDTGEIDTSGIFDGGPVIDLKWQVLPEGSVPIRYEEVDPFAWNKSDLNFTAPFAAQRTLEFFPGRDRDTRVVAYGHAQTEATFNYFYEHAIQTFFVEQLIDYLSETGISLDAVVNSDPEDILVTPEDNLDIFSINDFMTESWDDDEDNMMDKLRRFAGNEYGGSFQSDALMSSGGALSRFALFASVLLEPINSRIQGEIERRNSSTYTGTYSLPAWYEATYGVPEVPLLSDAEEENLIGAKVPTIVTSQPPGGVVGFGSPAEPGDSVFDGFGVDGMGDLGGQFAGGSIGGFGGLGGFREYAGGGYIGGWDGGMDDTIPAITDGSSMSALSSGEFVVPADVVSHLGDGNNQNGASKLYQLLDEVRTTKTGMVEQPAPINDGIVSNLLGDNNGF
mgnify:CR=1 FL=1|tara:strand:- start:1133 stop:4864 length:3732 start_codon:yes stop_codon:yes gene_type:complete